MVQRKQQAEHDYVRDAYDQHFKSANYLLVAHGAALVACLSVLKDYNTTPQLKGLGVLIVLECVGFLAAVLAYIVMSFNRSSALLSAIYSSGSDESMAVSIVMTIAVLVSVCCIFGTVIIVAVRFASL